MKEKIKALFKEYYNDETMPVVELEDKVLALFDVVGRNEQFYCNCSRAKGLDYDVDGMPYCIECQKPVQ